MIDAQIVISFFDSQTRDAAYRDLRANGNENEKKCVRYSAQVLMMEGAEGEIALDEHGRERYRMTFLLAYPRM